MKRRGLFLISWLILYSAHDVALGAPQRIVSLNPALTEIVFALGAGERLVGTTEYSNFPEAAKKVPTVGDYLKPNIERILELKPDLIVASPEGVDAISAPLRRAHLNWLSLRLKSLSDFEETVATLSKKLNTPEAGQTLLAEWKKNLAALKPQPSGATKTRDVLIQVDHDPLVVAGAGTFLAEGLSRCGLQTQPRDLEGYIRLNMESLSRLKPEIVVVTAHIKRPDFKSDIEKFWKEQKLMAPPKLFFGNPDQLSRLTPRFAVALGELCHQMESP